MSVNPEALLLFDAALKVLDGHDRRIAEIELQVRSLVHLLQVALEYDELDGVRSRGQAYADEALRALAGDLG